MKIIIAPDKFKGSLNSFEVCDNIEAGIMQAGSSHEVKKFPMADGGDGFGTVLQHYLNSETVYCNTVDPLGRPLKAAYQWSEANKTATIELASASGIALLSAFELNPLETTTYGTGIMIRHAIEKGAKQIILGLGGSATNDAGIGILAALGFSFNDANDNTLPPVGGNLPIVNKIIVPSSLPDVEFELACDVENPLFGPEGAAFVYAPQKGANAEQVIMLDEGLKHFSKILLRQTGIVVAGIPGTGAAGGIAAGLMSFFSSTIIEGANLLISISGIEQELKYAEVLITGEGCIDSQTGHGKIIGRLTALAKEYRVPVIGLCGTLKADQKTIEGIGLTYASSIVTGPISFEECIKNADVLLKEKATQVITLISSFYC